MAPLEHPMPGVPHSRVKRVWEQIRCETKMMWLLKKFSDEDQELPGNYQKQADPGSALEK